MPYRCLIKFSKVQGYSMKHINTLKFESEKEKEGKERRGKKESESVGATWRERKKGTAGSHCLTFIHFKKCEKIQ